MFKYGSKNFGKRIGREEGRKGGRKEAKERGWKGGRGGGQGRKGGRREGGRQRKIEDSNKSNLCAFLSSSESALTLGLTPWTCHLVIVKMIECLSNLWSYERWGSDALWAQPCRVKCGGGPQGKPRGPASWGWVLS